MIEKVVQYYGFRVGESVRIRADLNKRPKYFNDMGKMDYLFQEYPSFTIKEFTQRSRDEKIKYWVEIECLKDSREAWVIDVRDIVHLELDNRRIENV